VTERPGRIRCAVYTRKSTNEGLEQDFNSLDAQREAGEGVFERADEGQAFRTCGPEAARLVRICLCTLMKRSSSMIASCSPSNTSPSQLTLPR